MFGLGIIFVLNWPRKTNKTNKMKRILLSVVSMLAVCSLSAQTYFSDDFEGGVDAWTFIDSDGDGAGWDAADYGDGEGAVLTSASWDQSPLTPDNWAISPAIDLTSATLPTLYWNVKSQDQSWADENITVYVATASDVATLAASSVSYNEIVGTSDGYMLRTLDLSSFNGETVYVGLRHHDVTDMFRVNVASVSVKEMLAEDVTLSLTSSASQAITAEGAITSFDFNVVSYGSEALSGYTFNYTVDGVAGSSASTQTLNAGDSESFSIDLGEGTYEITAFVTNADGEQVGETIEGTVSVVPPVMNFEMTDTHGDTHNLYEELSSGNMVLLDFFASWCGPCESSTPEVNAVWEQFGSGQFTYQTYGITVEPTDNASVIDGLGWGAEYPKFEYTADNEALWAHYNGLYGGGGIPLFILICPDENNPGYSEVAWVSEGWATGGQSQDALIAAAQACDSEVSIEEVANTSLSIYPNPASNYATVNVSLVEAEEVVVDVVNALGQKVVNVTAQFDAGTNSFELPVEKLSTGVYYVNVKTSNGVVTEKLNILK